MMQAIDHRGPDSQGHWVDGDAGVALGHLRLAIVDLSPAGHQPMAVPSLGDRRNDPTMPRHVCDRGLGPRK